MWNVMCDDKDGFGEEGGIRWEEEGEGEGEVREGSQ
jgi:hypothetical protein